MTKKLKGAVESLTARVAREAEQARRKDTAEYCRLLMADDPAAAEELVILMGRLGFPPERLAADQDTLRRAQRLEAESAAYTPERQAEAAAAWEKLNAFTAETQRLMAEREAERQKLWLAANEFTTLQQSAGNARQQLGTLKRANPDLFDVAPVPADPMAHCDFGSPAQPEETEAEQAAHAPIPTSAPVAVGNNVIWSPMTPGEVAAKYGAN